MSNFKLILTRTFFFLFCLQSTNSVFASETITVSDGLNISTSNPMLGDEFRVYFSLREITNTPVSSVRLQVMMRNRRGGNNILVRDFGNVSFDAGETQIFGFQYSLVDDLELQAGIYTMAAGYTSVNGEFTLFDEENDADNRRRLDVSRTLFGFEGYIYGRTDKQEYRWIGRLPSGEFGHTWIDEACVRLFGAANQTGDWLQLSYLAPAGENVIANPCTGGLVYPNNVELYSGVTIRPSNPVLGERFEVFFDLNETDLRPVTFSNVQVSLENISSNVTATVNLGEVRFDPAMGRRLSAVFDSSELEAGTYRALARYQLLDGPLTNFEVQGDSANPQLFNIQSGPALSSDGYVFGRTDSTELRWVGITTIGAVGHTWIDEACAVSLGGVTESGTWADLTTLAPAGDGSVSNPCDNDNDEVPDILFIDDGGGYVFSRNDASEFRWVGRAQTGEFGHTWISSECAIALGGAGISGNWQRLSGLAPAGDQTVSNPCDSINDFLQGGDGYVFSRTDSPEFRWIARTASGEVGHTWVDEQCAQSLGGVSARGDWQDLRTRAPAGDSSVPNPC